MRNFRGWAGNNMCLAFAIVALFPSRSHIPGHSFHLLAGLEKTGEQPTTGRWWRRRVEVWGWSMHPDWWLIFSRYPVRPTTYTNPDQTLLAQYMFFQVCRDQTANLQHTFHIEQLRHKYIVYIFLCMHMVLNLFQLKSNTSRRKTLLNKLSNKIIQYQWLLLNCPHCDS